LYDQIKNTSSETREVETMLAIFSGDSKEIINYCH